MVIRRRFGRSDMEVMEESTLYQGFFRLDQYKVRHRLFAGGWGPTLTRELFHRNCAVGVLPYDPVSDSVALIEQFRVGALDNPAGPWLLELVAGIVESGEGPEAVAHRELEEESGITGAALVPVSDYLVSPGGTDERMVLYCGLVDLAQKREGIYGLDDEGEDILLHIVSREEALEAMARGLCNNAPLTIALQWLALHHERLRGDHGIDVGAHQAPA